MSIVTPMNGTDLFKLRGPDFSKVHAPMAEKLVAQGLRPRTPLEALADAEDARLEELERAWLEARHQAALAEFERDERTGAARVIRCLCCGLEFTAVLSPEEMRAFSRVPSGGYCGTCPPCRNTAAPAVN